jgi:hypothetical protein
MLLCCRWPCRVSCPEAIRNERRTVLQVKRLGDIYLIRLEHGEEVISRLRQFADTYRVGFGALRASGALERVLLGHYDAETSSFRLRELEEHVEVLALSGDVAQDEDGEPSVRAHVTVARSDYSTMGGRLMEATAAPALEIIVETAPGTVRRRHDAENGLDLWDLTARETLTV